MIGNRYGETEREVCALNDTDGYRRYHCGPALQNRLPSCPKKEEVSRTAGIAAMRLRCPPAALLLGGNRNGRLALP